MNRRDFIKSAAVMAGVSAITPFASASVLQNKPGKKVALKKSLGLGMIKEELSLTDKFKLAKKLGFDGGDVRRRQDLPEKNRRANGSDHCLSVITCRGLGNSKLGDFIFCNHSFKQVPFHGKGYIHFCVDQSPQKRIKSKSI